MSNNSENNNNNGNVSPLAPLYAKLSSGTWTRVLSHNTGLARELLSLNDNMSHQEALEALSRAKVLAQGILAKRMQREREKEERQKKNK